MIYYVVVAAVGVLIGSIATWVAVSRWFSVYKAYAEKACFESHKPYKLIIAGNYGQFRNWVQGHIINVYAKQHIQGRNLDEVEFIKVGDWSANEVLDFLRENMTKDQWEQFLNDPVC